MRHLLLRPTALFATLLFLGGASAEPWDLHDCAHHGDTHAAHVAVDHGGADHVVQGSESDDGGSHDHETEGHGPCTCVGTCGAAGGASVAASSGAPIPSAAALLTRDLGLAPDVLRASALSYLRPWANAPPV